MSSVIPAPHIAAASGLFSPDVIGLLVVSTNSELRRDLVSRLQSRRWSVKEASSGAAALETIESGHASLVLLDPALPDLRVDEFREILRAQYPHIEIVPINAHTGQPMVADPPPDSTSFEVVRDIGRGGPLKTESLPAPGDEPVFQASGGDVLGSVQQLVAAIQSGNTAPIRAATAAISSALNYLNGQRVFFRLRDSRRFRRRSAGQRRALVVFYFSELALFASEPDAKDAPDCSNRNRNPGNPGQSQAKPPH